MLRWKEVLIGVLGLAVIGSAILLSAEHSALKKYITANEDLKAQNSRLEEKVRKIEAASLQSESEKGRMRTEAVLLREAGQDENQKIMAELRRSLAQKESEYNALKKEYSSALEAYNELLKEEPADSQQRPDQRRPRFTPEQRQQLVTSWRDRTYEMMDRRIEAAATDYEAELLQGMKQRSANMFELFDELRNAQDDEERQQIRAEIAEERSALSELNDEYNSYQWKTLAEKFGVKDADEFVNRARELSQNRRYRFWGSRSYRGRWQTQ